MAPSPDSPAWSVSSKVLYAHGVESVLNETAERSSPGMDYSYLSTHYAPKWQTLDLKDQVDRFLAMPKPRHAPKETLWVFNFGFWDVWSLSALPIPAGKAAADAMTRDIFEQIERLYEASTDFRSIAWSDINYIPAPPEPETSPEAGNEEPPAEGPTEKRDEESAENRPEAETNAEDRTGYFRLLIPRITDPSLLPGWRDLRAQLPKVHSKAEQMRNSAELTEHWNDRIVDRLVEWVRKENRKGGEEENKESKRDDTDAAAAPSSPLADAPATQTMSQGKKVDKNPPQSRPSPVRDGFAYNMANYVLDAMVDRQLRNARLRDGTGRGDGSVDEGFRDVTNSCVERVDTALVAISVQSGVRLEIPNEEIGGDVQVPSAKAPKSQDQQREKQAGTRVSKRDKKKEEGDKKKSQAEDAVGLAATAADTVKVCQIPSDYLFYTPFALSQKAIGEIAVQTADMIRNNETIRAKLQAQIDKVSWTVPRRYTYRIESHVLTRRTDQWIMIVMTCGRFRHGVPGFSSGVLDIRYTEYDMIIHCIGWCWGLFYRKDYRFGCPGEPLYIYMALRSTHAYVVVIWHSVKNPGHITDSYIFFFSICLPLNVSDAPPTVTGLFR